MRRSLALIRVPLACAALALAACATTPDEPVDVQVVVLEHVDAAEMARTLQELAPGPDLFVRADPRTNSLLLRADGKRMAQVKTLIVQLDREVEAPQELFEVIRLEHTEAAALAATLAELHPDPTTKILTDARTNSLLVMASEADMAELKDSVARLDVEVVDPRSR
jgi:general secretion pathway protein D